MTSAEYRRQRREMARRRLLAKELAAAKAVRDESARRARVARDNEAFALKHGLSPDRIYQPQPQSVMSAGFGGLRPSPRPQDAARRAQRVDAILQDAGLL